MTAQRPGRPALPLPVWAAAGVVLSGALVTVAAAAGRALAGPALGVSVAALTAVVLSAAAATAATRLSRALRGLREQALHRLHESGEPLRETAAGSGVAELVDLARTLDALHLRVRVADEVADRHRKTAESASAGVFELLSGLVAAEEGARGQLAAELHDSVAQSLMAARALLATGVDGDVERAGELVAEAEEQVRAVMARTRPAALRDGDLAQAVSSLRDDLELRYGLSVDVRWPSAPAPMPLATAVTVYRFFQEGLLNVVKHADVDRAEVGLVIDGDGVLARVHDDGPGFDPDGVRSERGRHVGLGLLRERARLAGGSLAVTSRPGDGTTLTLRLPQPLAAPSAGRPGAVAPQQRRSLRESVAVPR